MICKNVYRAMKVLAEGFFAEQSNSLSFSMEDIRDVQENSLRLLYRLLFIFYAESRKLLNTDNKHYREMSLRKLKEEIAARRDQGETMLAVRSTYWEGLKDLFRLINDGSEALGYPKEEFYIPAYNGGLFDPAKNPFLALKKIGNSYLAEAIDLLARSKSEKGDEKGMVYVDYSSLEIRHLGSIYEGILEYKLHLADEPMVAIKEKGKEVWFPKREAAGKKFSDHVEAGSLYLVTDKGERKATGSFYTPEYIVKYIVKNTLAPLIDPMMEEAIWAEELRKDLLKKLLSLKVLDPAMGSGHFLVEATDYIAREIIHAKEIARREDLDSDEVAENDIHWARREVVRNCIYGVDLNPMAVELAKLSLWLTTVAANKPLSFLDHHLRCGNSLIGAELNKLMMLPNSKRDPGQLPMWQFVLRQQKEHTEDLLKRYAEMAAQPDDDLKTVKEKEKKYEELREEELSRRLNDLADIWLSTFFGNEVDEEEYQELQNYLSPRRFLDWSEFRTKGWFARAKVLASEKRFFHWELEFPEAFAGKENPGFEVVIGNPPYVRQERLGEDKAYFESKFKAYHGVADLYVYFFERGHEVLREGGAFGFISSNKFMRSNYGKPLRSYLRDGIHIKQIIDFGELPVFPEAATFPAIYLTAKTKVSGPTIYTKVQSLEFKSLDDLVRTSGLILQASAFEGENWTLSEENEAKILNKMEGLGTDLEKYVNGAVRRGVLTGLNEAFIIDRTTKDMLVANDPRNAEIIKPLVVGDDVRKYEINYRERYLIFSRRGIDIEKYPEVKKHLEQWKEKLAPKKSKKDDVGRKPGRYQWYELQDTTEYFKDFGKPKIIYPDIGITCRFTLDEVGYFPEATSFELPLKDLYLLSLLNSNLMFFFIRSLTPVLGDTNERGRLRFKTVYLRRLPIRRISFTTPAPERARLVAELQELYGAGKFEEILARVDTCLPKDDAGNLIAEQEKSDVVHDLLAFLAERMLEMNKQKQQEIKGFLGWLEGYVGAKVEDLTPKTKIQSYYEHDYEDFLAVLKKNRKLLAIDPARREPAEALRAEFGATVGKLRPLREQIEQTDKLIDAIVYRLYGLTEKEIRIVEGK
jgi:type I restriction-modification system DNA methylase subunit